MPGPYFSGQQPSACGHYYPDVLRLRDERRPDGTFVRILDCSYCGQYALPLDVKTLDKALVRKLAKHGGEVAIREEELPEVRKQEVAKFASVEETMKRGVQRERP
jgi:hypothetical protein